MKHPIQPVVLVGESDGKIARFQPNKIVQYLFKTGRLNLNEIACLGFDDDDHMQIAMLLGYSVSGFGDLSYADPVIVSEADQEVEKLLGGT